MNIDPGRRVITRLPFNGKLMWWETKKEKARFPTDKKLGRPENGDGDGDGGDGYYVPREE